jgi:hypothetical protein
MSEKNGFFVLILLNDINGILRDDVLCCCAWQQVDKAAKFFPNFSRRTQQQSNCQQDIKGEQSKDDSRRVSERNRREL